MPVNTNLILSRLVQASLVDEKDGASCRAIKEMIQELTAENESYNDGSLFDGLKYTLMKGGDLSNKELVKAYIENAKELKNESAFFLTQLKDLGRAPAYAAAEFYVENKDKYSKEDVIKGMYYIDRVPEYSTDISAAIQQAKNSK